MIEKLDILKLYKECRVLDEFKYDFSDDKDKFSYLFDYDRNQWLREKDLGIVFWDKYRKGYRLRSIWLKNIQKLAAMQNKPTVLEKLERRIELDNKKIQKQLEKKKLEKEKEKIRKSKITSHFNKKGKIKEIHEERYKLLLDKMYHFADFNSRNYKKCSICKKETNYYYNIETKKTCTDCLEELLKHNSLAYYHNTKRSINREQLALDVERVIKNKQFCKEVYNEVIIDSSERSGCYAITEYNEDFYDYINPKTKEEIYFIKTKGISYENRAEIVDKMTEESPIMLRLEPENLHDSQAVAIYTKVENKEEKIGYIPMVISSLFTQYIEENRIKEIEIRKIYEQEYSWWEYEDGFYNQMYNSFPGVCLKIILNEKVVK